MGEPGPEGLAYSKERNAGLSIAPWVRFCPVWGNMPLGRDKNQRVLADMADLFGRFLSDMADMADLFVAAGLYALDLDRIDRP